MFLLVCIKHCNLHLMPSKKNLNYLLACVLVLLVTSNVIGQSKWVTDVYGNVGCNIWLYRSKQQKFPGLRIYGSMSIMGTYDQHYMIHYGPSLSIYTKTVGASLNPLVGDYQIDFTNTFSIGYGFDKPMQYVKQLRTLHNGDFYNLITNQRYALFLSTNYLLNNHRRHQVFGAATATIGDVSVTYNNDAVPFNLLGLSDGFDRYWTGGGTIFVHHPLRFNRVEFGYDQYTGYKPLLYELANIIGINVPLYGDSAQKKKETPNNYNTSVYQLKIGTGPYTSFDVGFAGSMIDRKGRFWGVQDWIHLKGNYPFHPNKDYTRFFIGGSYNNLQNIKW